MTNIVLGAGRYVCDVPCPGGDWRTQPLSAAGDRLLPADVLHDQPGEAQIGVRRGLRVEIGLDSAF